MLHFMPLSMDLIMTSDKKGGFCKVKSKPNLHGAVVPKLERYEKRCNGFDVLEGFTMKGRSHQNVSKLQMFLVTLFAF